MSRALLIAAVSLAAMIGPGRLSAGQNVTGYESMANPYLLLLREPAVHEDLGLTAVQRESLGRLNAEVDGPLLALRNWSAERAQTKLSQFVEQTQAAAERILTADQRQRLGQIMLRVRGINLVLTPQVAERLRLTQQQQSAIQKTLDAAAEELAGLRTRLRGGESPQQIEALAREVRTTEQRQVLDALSDEQRQLLRELLGRTFDSSRLGRVSFKAPDFSDSAGWINSRPLRLEDLRGRVVAVHFWAFG
jgi:small-conductance mechanosensitive channel